jgi:hypothetical protein
VNDFVGGVTDLFTFLAHSFVDWGNTPVPGAGWSAVFYVAALMTPPFAARKLMRQREWLQGFALAGLWLYLLHNRLTLFNDVALTRMALVGNASLFLFGLGVLLPQRKKRYE